MPADHKLSPCSEQPRVLYLVAYKRRTSDAEPLALSQHPTKMAHSAGQVTTMTRQTDTWADRMAMFLEVTCVDNRIGGNAPLHPMLRSRHIRSAFRSPKRRSLWVGKSSLVPLFWHGTENPSPRSHGEGQGQGRRLGYEEAGRVGKRASDDAGVAGSGSDIVRGHTACSGGQRTGVRAGWHGSQGTSPRGEDAPDGCPPASIYDSPHLIRGRDS